MPGTSRLKWYVLLAIGVLFTIGGAWMIVDRAEHGWVVFLFFGLCTAVFIAELWPDLFFRRSAPPDVLLQQFPGPVVLKVAGRKFVYLMVGAAIFGGVCFWVLQHEQLDWFATILLWFCVVACALFIPLAILLMVQGSSLRLDGDGLRVRHGWRSHFSRWADTSVFEVAALPPSGFLMVVFDDAISRNSTMGAINAGLIGRSGALPDTYGLSPDELASLLNQWRSRALSGSIGYR